MFNWIHRYIVSLIIVLASFAKLHAIGPQHPEFLAVKQVQEQHTATLMAMPGVVATAVGLNDQNQVAVKVFVVDTNVAGIPATLDGKPVHVVVTGLIRALRSAKLKKPKNRVDRTTRFERPVPIGISTGHPDITAGTIACRVTDGENVYVVSNNQVFANENRATNTDPVLQPGVFDGGKVISDVIGQLSFFVPIVFEQTAANKVDAAIALTDKEKVTSFTPVDGYGSPKSQTIEPYLGMLVKKYGRTTGLTKGKIEALNATVDVQYDAGVARFVNQIIIMPGNFSAPGDSGSLIVRDVRGRRATGDLRPVGLLFAGNSIVTIANQIDDVLDAFGVTIDGS